MTAVEIAAVCPRLPAGIKEKGGRALLSSQTQPYLSVTPKGLVHQALEILVKSRTRIDLLREVEC